MNLLYDIYNSIYSAFNIPIGEFWKVTLTTGKLVGYFGVILFSGRWIIQMGASRVSGKPVLPRLFWYMSMSGSIFLLLYFIFGKKPLDMAVPNTTTMPKKIMLSVTVSFKNTTP